MGVEDLSPLLSSLGLALPPEKLAPALVHSSYANEIGGESNERLEFLGDAVLDLAVAEILFRECPDRDEGELSRIRSVAVSEPVLAQVAQDLGLERYIRVGAGAAEAKVQKRPSVLADALEAILGVVFLELGYPAARELTRRLLGGKLRQLAQEQPKDYKSLLQELGLRRYRELPQYRLLEAEGPEHEKVFTVEVSLGGKRTVGRGRNKKEAEQAAAKRLYLSLEEEFLED